MAIIYSYPKATIQLVDYLIGTKKGESGNPTKSFLVSDFVTLVQNNITTFVPYTGATGNVNLGAHDIYTTGGARLYDDGTIGGTSFQFTPSNSSLQDVSTTSRVWQLPDNDGAIALVSDVQALDLQSVVDVHNTCVTPIVITVASGTPLTATTNGVGANAISGTGGQYGAGVYGTNPISGTGVSGVAANGTGVSGNGAVGVSGTTSTGNAVYANATSSGTGLIAGSVSGIAINVLQGGVSISGGTGSVGYQLKLSSDSAAKPSTNTWTIASDSRIKENVNPYTKGLETIMAIDPITYDYNGLAGFEPTKGNIGIIAQDLLEVLPESIKTYHTLLNENDEEQTELYTFDSHALTFVLINAIKELKAEIETLKAK